MKNLTLTQVSDVLATVSYVISMEGEDIASTDLYELAGDLEQSIAAILQKAKEKEDAQRRINYSTK
jgi:hypothetical protein